MESEPSGRLRVRRGDGIIPVHLSQSLARQGTPEGMRPESDLSTLDADSARRQVAASIARQPGPYSTPLIHCCE
ncbi:hypothetical protein GCM10009674_11320 [Nesterenkonia xinjiangensis]